MTLKQQIIYSSTFVALLAGLAGIMSYKNSMSIKGLYAEKVALWNEEVRLLEELKTGVYETQAVLEEGLALKAGQTKRFRQRVNEVQNKLPAYTALGPRQQAVGAAIDRSLNQLLAIHHSTTLKTSPSLPAFNQLKEETATLFAKAHQAGFAECQQVGTYAEQKFAAILNWVLIACTLTFFLAIIFGQLIARDLSKAIERLRGWARRMEKGNYESSKKQIRNDEFGKLALTFSHLAEDLQKSKVIENQYAELELLNKELKKKNDSLDSFVYRVSHDLKAPVVNLRSLLKVILNQTNDSTDEVLHKTLFYMGATTQKLEQTIFDLLEVSRIEQSLEVEREMIDLKEVLEEVILENSEALERTAARITHRLEEASVVYFSRPNVKSLLSNLITNSIKYRSPERTPEIQLRTEVSEQYICLSIADNGIGIDLERHRDKLFGMFNRFHDHVEGSGVGLYIVKKLMIEAKGKLEIESQVNVGTTLRLFFVRHEVDEKELAEASVL